MSVPDACQLHFSWACLPNTALIFKVFPLEIKRVESRATVRRGDKRLQICYL